MKEWIKWLEGKKVIIGMVIILLNSVAQWQFPNALPHDMYDSIRLTGELIGGIGIFDKARRTETGKKIQEVITTATKKK